MWGLQPVKVVSREEIRKQYPDAWNPDGKDLDFRIESSPSPHIMFVPSAPCETCGAPGMKHLHLGPAGCQPREPAFPECEHLHIAPTCPKCGQHVTTGVEQPPRFKPGQWVRYKSGVLLHLIGPSKHECSGGWRWDAEGAASPNSDNPAERWLLALHECEPAVPREGEVWEYAPCQTHEREVAVRRSWSWSFASQPFMLEYVACGCLVPVNFGKG